MKKHFIRNRRIRWGGIAAVLTILVITVTVLTNAVFGTLAKRYQWFTPLNATANYDVTEDCYKLLGEFFTAFSESGTPRAEIIFCDTAENVEADTTQRYLYRTATSLAERYPDNIKISCYDIWTNPNTVRDYTTTLNPATGEAVETAIKSTSVVIVADGYHRVYSLEEFFVFKDGNRNNLWAYNGEKKLAAGIMHAIDPAEPVVCLTNNHGEVFYDYELLYLLDDAGYSIRYIDLSKDAIPENCKLIISHNPNSDLLVADEYSSISEVVILDEFLSKDGNSFFVFLENGTPALPNFESYLDDWGIEFGYYTSPEGKSYRHMVQDSAQSLTSDGYTIYGEVVDHGRAGEMMAELAGKTVFKNATSMQAAQGFVNNGDGSYTKGDRTLYSLYEGSATATSWANGRAVASADGAMLMGICEQVCGGATSYVGVVSSVDFCAEDFLQSAVYGNTDTMMRAFRVLGKEYTPEGLTIKPFESLDISTITTRQMLWWTVGLAATPAIVISVLAVTVLVKRRRA